MSKTSHDLTRRQLLGRLGWAALLATLPSRPGSPLGAAPATEEPATPGEPMAITRINQFTAKPGSGDELYALIESFLPYIRESDGCHEARLLRGIDDPDLIAVIEVWRDQEAHRASAQNVPPDTFPKAMALMAGPPGGAYYR